MPLTPEDADTKVNLSIQAGLNMFIETYGPVGDAAALSAWMFTTGLAAGMGVPEEEVLIYGAAGVRLTDAITGRRA